MADIVLGQGETLQGTVQSRYRDMEDGTHALVISTVEQTATYTEVLTGYLEGSNQRLVLAKSQEVAQVLVQADPDNPGSVWVGNRTAQTIELVAGASLTIPIDDPAKVYVTFESGANRVNWLAVR